MILASSSPRRRMILEKLTSDYRVEIPHVDEQAILSSYAFRQEYEKGLCVMQLALTKALDVAPRSGEIVVAADTLVFSGDRVMGKPKDREDAVDTLMFLAGKTHDVLTGVCVMQGESRFFFYETTYVEFYPRDDFYIRLVREYVDEGLHEGKAGSYGIQDKGSMFVKSIRGDYYNVMGLPIVALRKIKELMIPPSMDTFSFEGSQSGKTEDDLR